MNSAFHQSVLCFGESKLHPPNIPTEFLGNVSLIGGFVVVVVGGGNRRKLVCFQNCVPFTHIVFFCTLFTGYTKILPKGIQYSPSPPRNV